MGVKRFGLVGVCLLFSNAAAMGDFYVVAGPDNPKGKGTYQCEIKEGRELDDSGYLVTDTGNTQWFVKRYSSFRFNAATGEFRDRSKSTQWQILRPGNASWNLIANLPGVDPTFNILRIEVWNSPIRFTLTDGTDLYSGLCNLDG